MYNDKINRKATPSAQYKKVFQYLKKLSEKITIPKNSDSNDNSSETNNQMICLSKKYDKLPEDSILSESVFKGYLDASNKIWQHRNNDVAVFPFGCNYSQYEAVKNALTNQLSIIQGPPGTGKTQTILNILANLILENKTVNIVSNNDSALDNIREKLQKQNLDFIVAQLGKMNNKSNFIENQGNNKYPEFILNSNKFKPKDLANLMAELRENVKTLSKEMLDLYNKQKIIAQKKEDLIEVETQYYHYKLREKSQIDKISINFETALVFKKSSRARRMLHLLELAKEELNNDIGLKKRLHQSTRRGIKNPLKPHLFISKIVLWLFGIDEQNAIAIFSHRFFEQKRNELSDSIKKLEKSLKDFSEKQEKLTDDSMALLKAHLILKYSNRTRREFKIEEIWQKSSDFLKEYPIVLSTTFSASTNINNRYLFDYLIMDEASQVDIVTGALALTTAKNAVIVGDLKQLPNIVSQELAKDANEIFNKSGLPEPYSYTKNSFLSSVCKLFPNVPNKMLVEHYRCHPLIIGFCNKKFYDGKLILMKQGTNADRPLILLRTTPGNHARGHSNTREAEEICNEITRRQLKKESTGIITPYKQQVANLNEKLKERGFSASTVHKFQGKECDTIILSTVVNDCNAFVDDPNFLNVAVSRAKETFELVTSGNDFADDTNIKDLIDYIKYYGGEEVHPQLTSVFDLLYEVNSTERKRFLGKHARISVYDSENLLFGLLTDIIESHKLRATIGIAFNHPLLPILPNTDKLDLDEKKFVQQLGTHIDFLLFNKVTHIPFLAIEVDGYEYHDNNEIQKERDKKKNRILQKYDLKLLRFQTIGSNEKEKIEKALTECGILKES